MAGGPRGLQITQERFQQEETWGSSLSEGEITHACVPVTVCFGQRLILGESEYPGDRARQRVLSSRVPRGLFKSR